jgi:hypothetical protein
MEHVAAPGKRSDLGPRLFIVPRLVEEPALAGKGLVGADDHPTRPAGADGERLRFGETRGQGRRVGTGEGRLDFALVDARRLRVRIEPDGAQERQPRGARRGEQKRRAAAPERPAHLYTAMNLSRWSR